MGNPHGGGEGGESPHRLTAHRGDTVMARLCIFEACFQKTASPFFSNRVKSHVFVTIGVLVLEQIVQLLQNILKS